MTKLGLVLVVGAIGLLAWTVPHAAQQRPTWRQVLEPVTNLDVPEPVLQSTFPEPEPGRRFVRLDLHINPSAERLLIFAADGRFVRELVGWELATLPGDVIVYHQNQVHFSRAKRLEISIFDPSADVDRQIYPPPAAGELRRAFAARVDEAYKAIGEDWFRTNNHPMEAERFHTAMTGDVAVDAAAGAMTFRVVFGGEEPLTFSETVLVTCAPLAPVADITCREAPAPPAPRR